MMVEIVSFGRIEIHNVLPFIFTAPSSSLPTFGAFQIIPPRIVISGVFEAMEKLLSFTGAPLLIFSRVTAFRIHSESHPDHSTQSDGLCNTLPRVFDHLPSSWSHHRTCQNLH